MEIREGTQAPDFELKNQEGQLVRLSRFRGGPVVVFFYPKDETPGCTKEVCHFRDQYEVFREAGAEVVGISRDRPDAHQRFAIKHNLPFQLLSDPEDRTRKAWGVPKTLGLIPGRVTYVLDGDGVVRHRFSSQLAVARHVADALAVVRELGVSKS